MSAYDQYHDYFTSPYLAGGMNPNTFEEFAPSGDYVPPSGVATENVDTAVPSAREESFGKFRSPAFDTFERNPAAVDFRQMPLTTDDADAPSVQGDQI